MYHPARNGDKERVQQFLKPRRRLGNSSRGFVACSQGPCTLEPREPGDPPGATEPPDTAPAFAGTVVDQTYTVGGGINPLTLPAASGGNGTLS